MMVKEIMNDKYSFIDIDEKLSEAIKMFNDETDVLFVYEKANGKRKYKGIVTEKIILKSGLKLDAKVRRLFVHAPKIRENEDVVEAMRLMIENDVLILPVADEDNIKGVISIDDIFKAIEDGKIKMHNLRAKDVMAPGVILVSPRDNVYSVMNLFKQNNISRVPVVEDGEIVGIISIHDIVRKAIEIDKNPDVLVAMDDVFKTIDVYTLMSPTVHTANMDEKVEDIIGVLDDENSIVVLDRREIAGIITKYDVLERIIEINRNSKGLNIQLSSKVELERDKINDEIKKFCERHNINEGSIYLYVTKSSNYLYQIRMRFNTNRGKFSVKSEDKDIVIALKDAFHTLKRKLGEN